MREWELGFIDEISKNRNAGHRVPFNGKIMSGAVVVFFMVMEASRELLKRRLSLRRFPLIDYHNIMIGWRSFKANSIMLISTIYLHR